MILLLVTGLGVLAGVAVVLTIVDRVLESRWRLVAAGRREDWMARHGAAGAPWTDTWQDD